MTQRSLPQDGASPAYIDGGPYGAKKETRRDAFLSNDRSSGFNLGVVINNGFSVTVTAQPGELICDGTYLASDDVLTFNLSWEDISVIAGSYVYFTLVAISNRSENDITGASLTAQYNYDLWFPNTLTDYDNTASIKPRTVRLAMLVTNSPTLMSTDPLHDEAGEVVLMFCNSTMYIIDGGVTLIDPQVMHFPRTAEGFSVSTASSRHGLGLLNMDLPVNSASSTIIVNGNIYEPMFNWTGGSDFNLVLGIETVLSDNPEQKIYQNGDLLTQQGGVNNIYLSSEYPTDWSVMIFQLELAVFYNYIVVTGNIMYSYSGLNYQGIGTHSQDDARSEDIYGLIYCGDGDDFSKITKLSIFDTANENIGAGSFLSYRSL